MRNTFATWMRGLSRAKSLSRDHAEAVMAGRVRKSTNSNLYEPPKLPHGTFFIIGATVDANANVYFVLNGSSVMFNVGLIRRQIEAALLGDGSEPRIVNTNHLRGD